MRGWLTRNRGWLWALGIIAAVGIAFSLGWHAGSNDTNRKAYAAVWDAILTLQEPERCALCSDGMPYRAPCLINLATGQMGELRVYTPHSHLVGEIALAEMQQTGTFNFQPCAGLMAIHDTCDHTCEVTNCFIWDYRVSVTSRKGASADLCVTGLLTN